MKPKHGGPARSALCVLVFLASYAAGSAWVAARMPWPAEYGQRAKFEYFKAHKDEFDAIFVGSSVTFYGVVPEVFDRVLGERGHALRSFNFGVGAMTSLEAEHLLRRVMDLEPARLRHAFVEADGWDARIWYPKNKYSARMVHWHTPAMTKIALETLAKTPRSPSGDEGSRWKWSTAWTHLQLLARKVTSAGQGKRWARAALGLDADEVRPTVTELETHRGYVDLDVIDEAEWDRRHERYLNGLDDYRRRVARIDAENAQAVPIDSHTHLAGLRAQIARLREAGVEPAYYIGPRAAGMALPYRLAEAGELPVLFGFNQPKLYPELYRENAHFDPNHLRRAGAEEFTRLFAEAFADSLQAD